MKLDYIFVVLILAIVFYVLRHIKEKFQTDSSNFTDITVSVVNGNQGKTYTKRIHFNSSIPLPQTQTYFELNVTPPPPLEGMDPVRIKDAVVHHTEIMVE